MPYTYDQLKDLEPLPFWPDFPTGLPTPEFIAVALACNPVDKALDYVNHAAAATGGFTWQLRRVGYLLLHPEEIEVPHAAPRPDPPPCVAPGAPRYAGGDPHPGGPDQ